MGGGRDKRKKAKGKTPGIGDEKTNRKTEKNETKAARRLQKKTEVFLSVYISFGQCITKYSFYTASWQFCLTSVAGLARIMIWTRLQKFWFEL